MLGVDEMTVVVLVLEVVVKVTVNVLVLLLVDKVLGNHIFSGLSEVFQIFRTIGVASSGRGCALCGNMLPDCAFAWRHSRLWMLNLLRRVRFDVISMLLILTSILHCRIWIVVVIGLELNEVRQMVHWACGVAMLHAWVIAAVWHAVVVVRHAVRSVTIAIGCWWVVIVRVLGVHRGVLHVWVVHARWVVVCGFWHTVGERLCHLLAGGVLVVVRGILWIAALVASRCASRCH